MLELAKLYATVTYFHPTAGPLWAEATEQHATRVFRGPTVENLRLWLEALHDSATGVMGWERPTRVPTPGYTANTAEGWPLLVLSDIDWLLTPEGEARLAAFLRDAGRAPAAVLDLRTPMPASHLAAERFATLTNGIAQPALWQRAHYGKVPEAASATGDFRTGWVMRDAALTAVRWARLAVLVTQSSRLPPFALALAQQGQAALFFEGEGDGILNDWAPTTRFALPLPAGLVVQVRTGSTPKPTLVRAQDALAAAREWLTSKSLAGGLPTQAPTSLPALTPPKTHLHAALRLWSAVWLLHPQRDTLQKDWERAWPGFLAQVQAAPDALRFHQAVRRLLRVTRDGHALTLTPLDGQLFGNTSAAVRLQTVAGKPTIVALRRPAGLESGAQVGDVVVAVDGVALARRREQLDPFLAAGTPQARENYLNNRLLLGERGSLARLTLEGGRSALVPRLPAETKERSGEPVRVLAGGAVYADLDRLTRAEIAPFFARHSSAPALIFDLRGYVEETAWELAPYLAPTEPLVGAKFVRPVALPPDDGELVSRHWEEVFYQRLPLRTGQVRYRGRVAALIDERTQSQAEHTALFLRACGALLVGSPTAGAVGDVTNLLLTDGIVVRFSGQEVRFPDDTRVAGVGIQPQRRIRPTRKGLQAGRDEVLDVALKAILSRG